MSADDLPAGWCEARISDIATVVMGQSPPSSTYNSVGEGLPFFQGKGDFGEVYPAISTWCDSPTKVANKDDILLSVRAPVGSTNLAPAPCCIGRGIAAIQPAQGVSSKFLLYALRRFADALDALGTGTTFKAVSGHIVRDFSLPVPPSAEQLRVIDRLEELLTNLSTGVTALERCQEKLRLYRASVLKAAVEGDLTADWRPKHSEAEPASILLQRILAERRAHWEKEQLRTYAERGKPPPKNWKARYKEPVAPELTDLPPLPPNWQWVGFDQIGTIQGGLQKSPARAPKRNHFPYLRVANVRQGRLQLDELHRFELTPQELAKLRLEAGDLLLVEGNGSRTEIGRCALWKGEVEDCVHQNHIIRVRLAMGVLPQYADIFLNSPIGQFTIQQAASSTSGLYTLNVNKVKRLALALPPTAEQQAIVDRVEGHLSGIDQMDAVLSDKLAGATSLRQSILHQAFTGKLLPQDPNDEPASKLIERIGKERDYGRDASR